MNDQQNFHEKEDAGETDICESLTRILQDGVDIHRCQAAQALGRMRIRRGVLPLTRALLDEDEDVRIDAATALTELADPDSAKQLLENLLGDPSNDVKRAALEALVRIKDPKVVPWLKKILKGRDEGIVWDETEFHQDGWDDWTDLQITALKGLAAFGVEDAVPDILEAIEDEFSQDLTEPGFPALARLGLPGQKALDRYLEDDEPRVRRRAAACLAAIPNGFANEAVGKALKDPAPEVRMAALRGMAKANASDPRLPALFMDPQTEVRVEAIRLCGVNRPGEIVSLLDDKTADVRGAALGVLKDIAGDLLTVEVLETVRQMLSDPTASVAAAAVETLAELSPEAIHDDLIAMLEGGDQPLLVQVALVHALGRIGKKSAVQALSEGVKSDHRQMRLESMSALSTLAQTDGGVHATQATDVLLAALRGELVQAPEPEPESESESESRAEKQEEEDDADLNNNSETSLPIVTSTLEAIMEPAERSREETKLPEKGIELSREDMERLALARKLPKKKKIAISENIAPHQDVRIMAARFIGDLGQARVSLELALLMKEEGKSLRLAAVESLARMDLGTESLPDEVIKTLVAALAGGERDIRLLAVRAMGAVPNPECKDAIVACLADADSFVRKEAVAALAGYAQARTKIEELMGDEDLGVRSAAAAAIAAYGDVASLVPLIDFAFAQQGYHRREAGRLLCAVDPAAAISKFVSVLNDADREREWPIAIEALEELFNSNETTIERRAA